MNDLPSIETLVRWLARPYWAVLQRVGKRPFVVRPYVWSMAFFAAVAALFVSVVVGSFYAVVVLLFLTAVPVSALAGWLYLKWPADLRVVFYAQFMSKTDVARDAAINHLDALGERLKSDEVLSMHFAFRALPQTLSPSQARTLLEETGSAAIIFGEVRASGEVARWKLEMLLSWPGQGPITNIRTVAPGTLTAHGSSRLREAPPRHEQMVDAEMPLTSLGAERFDSKHVSRALGTLLVLAAAEAGDDSADRKRCLEASIDFVSVLSPQTRAAYEIASAIELASLDELIARLDRAASEGADHPDLWNSIVGFSFLRFISGEIDAAAYQRRAHRAMQSDPTSALSHYNLGEAYLSAGKFDDALAELQGLEEDPEYSKRYYLHLAIGTILYSRKQDFSGARDAYRRSVELHPTPQGHLYLADAHRALSEFDRARTNYRAALLLDPSLVDAHRGYWGTNNESGYQPFSSDSLWDRAIRLSAPQSLRRRRRLRPVNRRLLTWHYRRHPEDSRIHYMIGAAALIGGNLVEAEKRLRFADELLEGNDLEAQARLAVALGLQGRLDEAEALLIGIRKARIPRPPGGPNLSRIEGKLIMIIEPFLDEPELAIGTAGVNFQQLLMKTFPEAAE